MLNYTVAGSGPVIILLHGFCENNTCFRKQVLLLKDDYTVLTPDLPGFGASAPISLEQASMNAYADAVKEMVDHTCGEPCIMLGHSMGGYVTLAFAAKYPDALAGFGLIHSTASADSEERRQKRKQALSFISSHGKEAYIRNFIPTMFANASLHPDDVDMLVSEGLKGPVEGITGAICAMMERQENFELLRSTFLPVFFGVGALDGLIPERDMLHQASLCRNADLCYLDQSGHMGMLEEPQKLCKAISEFAIHVASGKA
jgi:pimeloyl-ACP methyl ester carboxylesterase